MLFESKLYLALSRGKGQPVTLLTLDWLSSWKAIAGLLCKAGGICWAAQVQENVCGCELSIVSLGMSTCLGFRDCCKPTDNTQFEGPLRQQAIAHLQPKHPLGLTTQVNGAHC